MHRSNEVERALVQLDDPVAEEDLDIELVPNGPLVQAALVKMLERGQWKAENREEEG